MHALRASSLLLRASSLSPKQSSTFCLAKKIHLAAVLNDKSYYEILHIPEEATQSEIKEAYYKLSKIYHPDVKKDEGSLAMFRSITEAYDVLGNVKSRMEYDKKSSGIGLDYDTSQEPFYNSLYKDNLELNRRAPDFERLLAKRTKLEQYLKDEYKDRLSEVKMGKNRSFLEEMRTAGTFGIQRHLLVCYFALFLSLVTYTEMVYNW